MSKNGCELCGNPARMFCESDQASLCWDCDEKVHAANFLVAKHSRTLLCHACHSPTPWKAAGPKLQPTMSLCHNCADVGGNQQGRRRDHDSQESESDHVGEYYSSDSTEVEGEAEEDEEEEEENQVVPWSNCVCSSTPSSQPQPPLPVD